MKLQSFAPIGRVDSHAITDGNFGKDVNVLLVGALERFDRGYRGKGLQLKFTVEDPSVFAMPWSATSTFLKAGGDWREMVCAENTREYYDNKDTAIPTAEKPDF